MKKIYINKYLLIPIVALCFGSCVNDLDISSIDPQSTQSFDQEKLFTKQYALLGLTGQEGNTGNPDLAGGKEDESGFYRTTFNCNELSSDECIWAWQENDDIPEYTFMRWNSSLTRTEWVYSRLGYNITQFNFFLDKTEGSTDEETIHQRAEVRFLRALHYWYFLDLFGKAPFKDHFSEELPTQIEGKALYDYIQNELTDIENDLYDPRKAPFGRADKAADWLLKARLYLNAEVYTGTADWNNAKEYADKVINSSYKLCPKYSYLFMADNDENELAKQEIILPIRQDGAKTRCDSGSDYLVRACRCSGMPYCGTINVWSCIFARTALIQKFFPDITKVPTYPKDVTVTAEEINTEEKIVNLDKKYGLGTDDFIAQAGDDRAMFYNGFGGGKRSVTVEEIAGFNSGLSIVKWQNIRSDGKATHDVTHVDTDIPLLRLSEAYLIRAEVLFRTGGDASKDINVLRSRANCKRLVQTVTEQDIIDEWCREFYMEGRRRVDLKRFGLFTTNKYLWDWKGGIKDGTSVPSKYNLFPIPDSDLNNNKNLTQNEGF